MEGTRTDEALVRAIRQGEVGAFDQLYTRYADRLFGFLLRHLKSRAEAEDALQDVFMTVLRDDALRLQEGKFAAWLFRVARNRAVSQHRRRARAAEHQQTIEESEPADSPESTAQVRELVGHVERAMDALSPSHAEALVLKVVGGLTYRQIADVQEVPEGTAKSRLHFAVRSVRRFLSNEERKLDESR